MAYASMAMLLAPGIGLRAVGAASSSTRGSHSHVAAAPSLSSVRRVQSVFYQSRCTHPAALDRKDDAGFEVVARRGGRGRGGGRRGGRGRGGRGRGNFSREEKPSVLMNRRITVPEVRLLGIDKEPLGVLSTADAQEQADDAGVDLVMISPEADPPVCRLMDYKKYKFDQEKKQKEAKKTQKQLQINQKELKMRYNIDEHDYNVRLKSARKFLSAGDKVKLLCQFRGREADFKDMAEDTFLKFAAELDDVGSVESAPRVAGRQMIMILTPNMSKANIKAAKDKAERQAARQARREAMAASGGAEGSPDDESEDDDDQDYESYASEETEEWEEDDGDDDDWDEHDEDDWKKPKSKPKDLNKTDKYQK